MASNRKRRDDRGGPTSELSPEALAKLLAELNSLPRWQPPEAESPEQVRQRLEAYLRRVTTNAEAELKRLGHPPDAWRQVSAHLTDTMPLFAFGSWAEQLLGAKAPKGSRGAIPTRGLRAFTEIERKAKQCHRCRAAIEDLPAEFVGHAMVVQAQGHHKVLFRRYQAELARTIPTAFQEMPAWAAAYRAATAQEALENLDRPMAAFAAGRYLERQQMIEYLLRTLHSENRRAVRRGVARYEHDWHRRAGLGKSGKISPHTALVRAAVKALRDGGRPPPNADAVLALLTGDPEDDQLDAVRDALNPILLPDDEPLVDVEDGKVVFRFKDRPDRTITLRRLRNMVSEAQ